MALKRTVIAEHRPLVPQDENTERAGTLVRLTGQRGTYRVVAEVTTKAGSEWVELWKQGTDKHYRAVSPDRVIWPTDKRR